MKLSTFSCVCAGLVLAGAGAQAGMVSVAYVHPEGYTDARDWNRDTDENLKTLTQHFQWLGQKYLPPDQRLQIEVLDVDLAGRLRPSSRWGMVRVVGKPLDWPQIKLRYRLESGGKLLASGEESVSDMAYAQHVDSYSGWQPLPQEKRMLKTWFRSRLLK
jgi:hypothetical protein